MPSVPTMTSTCSWTPASATAPRPPGPRAPVPCASSTSNRTPCREASSASSCRGATSPSIENTPSVTISAPRPRALRDPPREVVDVAMVVDEHLGAREPAAVDDRRMVELVGEHHFAGASKRRDRRPRSPGSPSRTAMRDSRPLNAARRPRARWWIVIVPDTSREAPAPGAPAHRGLGCRLAHARMVRQPQVVVGAQQQHRLAVEQHVRALRARDRPGLPVEPEGLRAPAAAPRARSSARAPRARAAIGHAAALRGFRLKRSCVDGSHRRTSSRILLAADRCGSQRGRDQVRCLALEPAAAVVRAGDWRRCRRWRATFSPSSSNIARSSSGVLPSVVRKLPIITPFSPALTADCWSSPRFSTRPPHRRNSASGKDQAEDRDPLDDLPRDPSARGRRTWCPAAGSAG